MPPADSVPEFETRPGFYKIDDRVCSILAAAWPIVAPTINRSIKELSTGFSSCQLVNASGRIAKPIIKLELAHFQLCSEAISIGTMPNRAGTASSKRR
jgi:hypothetical protein